MSITESERVLDSIVQQTWKRIRTAEEIGAFLARRELALQDYSEEILAQKFFTTSATIFGAVLFGQSGTVAQLVRAQDS